MKRPSIARATSRPASTEMSAMTTDAPASASARAVARPIPPAPPVTRAIWSLSMPGSYRVLGCTYKVRKQMAEESLVASHPDVAPLLTERAQRAKLLEAMVQVVAEKGYAAATVADAVKLARVSRGTFYELFESKQQCLATAFLLGVVVFVCRFAVAVLV